jgi:hypothetical protein
MAASIAGGQGDGVDRITEVGRRNAVGDATGSAVAVEPGKPVAMAVAAGLPVTVSLSVSLSLSLPPPLAVQAAKSMGTINQPAASRISACRKSERMPSIKTAPGDPSGHDVGSPSWRILRGLHNGKRGDGT